MGILQARILEWIAMLSSRGVFPTQGSNLSLLHYRRILYHLSLRGSLPEPASATIKEASEEYPPRSVGWESSTLSLPLPQPRFKAKSKGFEFRQIGVQTLALPSTGAVTLGKWLHL